MKQQYCGVIQTLQELDSKHNDATAAGLLKKMKNAKFIGRIVHFSRGSSSSFKSFLNISKKQHKFLPYSTTSQSNQTTFEPNS